MKLAKTHYFLLMFGTLTVVSAVFIVDHYRSRFSPEPSVTASDDYQIISRSCWFDIPSGESIDCGELRTPASSGAFTLPFVIIRSEEHTSELQSRENLVCRLLLEKKKKLSAHV